MNPAELQLKQFRNYLEQRRYSKNTIKTYLEGRKKGFVDEAGNEVIPCIYHDVKTFSGGKAQVQKEKDGQWMTIDVNGKEVK